MTAIFKNFKEKNAYNSTAFIEIQFCKLSDTTSIKKKTVEGHIKHFSPDSLYIHHTDIDKFVEEYGGVFISGKYANQKTGLIDPYGINYYQRDQINDLIQRIFESKPTDYAITIEWLIESLKFNGFYILGI